MNNPEFTIRQADGSYASEICSVLITSITEVCLPDHQNVTAKLEEWLSNKTPDNVQKWIENNSNHTIIALNSSKEVIGVSMVTKDGEILLNYLIPSYLHKGIGKAMLKAIETFAVKNNLKSLSANSTITALPFYKKNGFTINIENPESDNLSLIKVLQD